MFRDSLRFAGGQDVEGQVIRITPDSAPLGELKLIVGAGAARREASAIVSLSTQWVVTNYEEMFSLLRYFDDKGLLDTLRKAAPGDRTALWRRFYRGSDPNPATPENEALELYFTRLAVANTRFRDEGVPGWRTDRGEVYIRLGEPDEVYDQSPLSQGRDDPLGLHPGPARVDIHRRDRLRPLQTDDPVPLRFDRVVDRHRRRGPGG